MKPEEVNREKMENVSGGVDALKDYLLTKGGLK